MKRPSRYWGVMVLLLQSCIKIDGFDKPHSMEAFTGPLEVDSSIQALSAGARSAYIISISTDATGKKAYVSGIPPETPFYIIPTELWKELRTQGLLKGVGKFDLPPSVSGLETTVIDKHTLKVIGFQQMSSLAKNLGLEVAGEIVREGAQATSTEDIIITANVGKLKAMLPKILLDELFHDGEKKSLSQLADDKQINMYRFQFRGDVITAF